MPVLRRGPHAALSPNFGAPATPAPWHTAHTVSYAFLPSGLSAAAGAAAATATAAAAGTLSVLPRPALNMYSMARLISTSDRSAMPPRAGMPPCPLSADCVTAANPVLTRFVHAARSPIFGAPPSPVWWHLPQAAATTCSPVRSVPGAAGAGGSFQLAPALLAIHTTARSTSTSARSGLPPFAGIPRMPLSA